MECCLHEVKPIGTESEVSCDLFISEVVMFHLSNDIYKDGIISSEKLSPISRLGGADYAKLAEFFSIERPKL